MPRKRNDEWGCPPQQIPLIGAAHTIRTGLQLYQLARKVESLPTNWDTEGEAVLEEMKALFSNGNGWYDWQGESLYNTVARYINWQRSQPRQLCLFK